MEVKNWFFQAFPYYIYRRTFWTIFHDGVRSLGLGHSSCPNVDWRATQVLTRHMSTMACMWWTMEVIYYNYITRVDLSSSSISLVSFLRTLVYPEEHRVSRCNEIYTRFVKEIHSFASFSSFTFLSYTRDVFYIFDQKIVIKI